MSNIPITVCGTIAADPQSRTLPTGRACASLRLAVNHWKVDKATGEFLPDSTSWFGVDCYGALASNVGASVTQGMSVIVQGHLRNREWSSGERSGIAPTIIADHLGPDLRFGTANYQKSHSPSSARRQEPTADRAGSADSWGGLVPGPDSRGAALGAANGGRPAGAGATVSPGVTTSPDAGGVGAPRTRAEEGVEAESASGFGSGAEPSPESWSASEFGPDSESESESDVEPESESAESEVEGESELESESSDAVAAATADAAAPF